MRRRGQPARAGAGVGVARVGLDGSSVKAVGLSVAVITLGLAGGGDQPLRLEAALVTGRPALRRGHDRAGGHAGIRAGRGGGAGVGGDGHLATRFAVQPPEELRR